MLNRSYQNGKRDNAYTLAATIPERLASPVDARASGLFEKAVEIDFGNRGSGSGPFKSGIFFSGSISTTSGKRFFESFFAVVDLEISVVQLVDDRDDSSGM